MNPRSHHSAFDGLGDFVIEKRKQRVASIDQMHFDTKRGKGAGILRADHACAYHRHGFGQHANLKNFVRIVHAWMLERELRRTHGR